ncbi:MAG: rod shape-determining protein, partial [Bacteroidales bacterium]|nr:rod shape-determining protein [Bacteroidales bacterium]
EELKVMFGSALAGENREEEVVAIPGLRGRPPKEITLKNLANIIQARMEEIIENIYYEIKNSGFEKKLIAGIVLTGGGAQLKHVRQLTEYMTGMDVRIGYPNEHLAPGCPEEMTSPMYATGIGLVIMGLQRYENEQKKRVRKEEPVATPTPQNIAQPTHKEKEKKEDETRRRTSFLERIQRWFDEGSE